MRIFLAVVLLIGLGVVAGFAADHSNATEKKTADEITISKAVKVGDKVLEPGRYRVTCDKEQVTFEGLEGKHQKVSVPCKGQELTKKITATRLILRTEGEERIATAIDLRGSNVEHAF